MTSLKIKLRKLHPKQTIIAASKAKRKVVKAGRRGGKTVYAADDTVNDFLLGKRVLYAVPTSDQLTKWWFEVVRALKEPIEAGIFVKNETDHTITKPGTENRIRGKTAWNAATLRGDYADKLILDEVQLMSEDTWDEVGAPMLLDNDGDVLFIYTPPSLISRSTSKAKDKRWITKLAKKHIADKDKRWEFFSFTSHDNPHISKDALLEITKDMSSVAYRQEILGEEIEEAAGALFRRDIIERNRLLDYDKELVARVVVAIDPALTSEGDEAGIVAANQMIDGSYNVIADISTQGSPLHWAKQAILLYDSLKADCIVVEKNAGGEMLPMTLTQAAKELYREGLIKDMNIVVRLVQASRGKATRADPISVLYERNLVHHIGQFVNLEDELCLWTPGEKSPNRLDAMVWALAYLSISENNPAVDNFENYLIDYRG